MSYYNKPFEYCMKVCRELLMIIENWWASLDDELNSYYEYWYIFNDIEKYESNEKLKVFLKA
jgi:hypothetical protein